MINVSLDTVVPTPYETIDILKRQHMVFGGIPLDYDRICEYYGYYMYKGNYNLRRVNRYITGKDEPIDADTFKRWITNISTEGLLKTESGKDWSVSADSIESALATGLYDKATREAMKLFAEGMSMRYKVSVFYKLLNDYPILRYPTFDNHRMIVVSPFYSPQNTGRLGMNDPAMQNISRELKDIRTVPRGWVYVYTDSGQIEPRIILSHFIGDKQLKALVRLYGDAYYAYVHYCTKLTKADIASGRTDFKPFEITDEMKEMRSRFKTYGNAVMYGSKVNASNDPFKEAFIDRIGNHNRRIEWYNRVRGQVSSGCTVFSTVFGTQVSIEDTKGNAKYKNNPDALFNHKVKAALNCEVQGTAADLGRLSIKKADFLIQRKAPNSCILEWVHDSDSFAVHEDEYGIVGEELSTITGYNVEGWVPIEAGPEIGISNSSGLLRFML